MVEGIEYTQDTQFSVPVIAGWVNKELFSLKMINEKGKAYIPNPQRLHFSQESSGCCLSIRLLWSLGKTNTIVFSCPYIFGDDARHEIVAYCKERKNHYDCYRLTLDGKDIETLVDNGSGHTSATIILDYIKPDE